MDKAYVLVQQARYDLAEQELRQELAASPENPMAHAMLAICLLEGERLQEATDEAKEAIHEAPDLPYAHYVLARVLHEREHLNEAKTAIEEAIRLDPEEADYFGQLSSILYSQRKWRVALDAAEQGLAFDSENVSCSNLRAMALVKLGRKEEAGATIESALAKDPENAVTHANQGWALLHQADYEKALAHFREALRLDPELDWAREGIVEALKAKHFVYGLMLRYFLWMGRLDRRVQWGVILGGYFGYQMLRSIVRANPGLSPWITPMLIVYVAFVLFTWIADPLFDLVLRLNRFGRLALSKEKTTASNWIGGCLFLAVLGAFAWLVTRQDNFLFVALVFGPLVLPLSGVFRCWAGWPRNVMVAYSALAALIGLAGLALIFSELDAGAGVTLTVVSTIGSMLSSWIINGLVTVRPKR